MAFTYYYSKSGFDTFITVLKDDTQVYQNKSATASREVLLEEAKLALKDNYPNQGVETMTEVPNPTPPPPPVVQQPQPTPTPVPQTAVIKVPENQILVKEASEGEFVYSGTNTPFSGSYYQLNNKFYEGSSFNFGALSLTKAEKSNKLLRNGATAIFSFLSGITSDLLSAPIINEISGFPDGDTNYFYTQTNVTPSIIKEIDEESYRKLQNNPLYKTTFIGIHDGVFQNEDQAEQQIPGVASVRSFLAGDTFNPPLPLEPVPIPPISQPIPIVAQPRVQDIIPVGPIFINPTPIAPPPPPPPASSPVLSDLSVSLRTNNSVTINATVVSTTNSTINRIGTSYNTTPGFLYTNALDTGGTSLGAFSQNRTGLSPETFYYYFAYAMNNDGFTGSIGESTFWSLSNPATAQASSLVATPSGSDRVLLSWNAATFPGSGATNKTYILLRSISPNIPNITNSNGEVLTLDANTTFQDFVVFNATNFTASVPASPVSYTFKLIPVTYNTADIRIDAPTANYLTSGAPTATATMCTAESYTLGDPYYDENNTLIGYIYYKDTCNIYVVGTEDLLATDESGTEPYPPAPAQWGCLGQVVLPFGLGDTSIGGGEVNTTDIRTSGCAPTSIVPFAAQLSYDYRSVIGATWSLPTIGDWAQIYAVKDPLNTAGANLSNTDYWSSNESGKTNAYAVNPQSGAQSTLAKNNGLRVRPVTKISNPIAKNA